MPDKTIKCKECKSDFRFTEQDQEFFREKVYRNEPTRCPDCRAAKKNQSDGSGKLEREMFPAVCAGCGKETTVPFKPSGGKPVYCRDCYQQRDDK